MDLCRMFAQIMSKPTQTWSRRLVGDTEKGVREVTIIGTEQKTGMRFQNFKVRDVKRGLYIKPIDTQWLETVNRLKSFSIED